jgi:GNAT superfamily N-acetyltransferase
MMEVLRPEGELGREYPLVFDGKGPGRVMVLKQGGMVVSACAVLERELLHPGGRTKVGFIGSVSTHPDSRGRGLATQLLTSAEEELRAAGCEHAILWADDPAFYARKGYALDGDETDFLIDSIPGATLVEGVSVRTLEEGDEAFIHELYTWHGARVERSPKETARLLGCPRMRVLLAIRGIEPIAYLCFGRGGDLAGVAHEWGGAPEGVLACLSELLQRSEPVFLMAPGEAGPMGELLDSCGALRVSGRLGMTKALGSERSLPQGAFIWGLDSI